MKIVLVNLPWKKSGFWGVRAGSRWPHIKGPLEKNYSPFPFFLAYAAALLIKEGFQVKLIDALAEELPAPLFLKRVLDEKPDLLVAETSTPSLENDLEILARLPKGLPVVLCGPEANIRTAGFFDRNKFVDYVLVGEYEYTLLELAKKLEKKESPANTLGLIYRDKGALKINPLRPLIEDLDIMPFPLREGLAMEKYNDNPGGIPVPSVQMWASRGCPYQCLFCLWPQLMYRKGRYRARNVANVVDEMEYLVKMKNFKSVYFDDDTANIGKLRMLEFAKEIKRRQINVPWAMMARPDLMDKEILESLRSAGLYAVKYGVESSDQNLLDGINKNMDIRKTRRVIEITKSLGIKTHLTFT
ncbi:MAG: radical SAM protein, partial [Candidatus Omnitrophica bacterium]|nr:radical SAM protein [Candidatus Omnitrophota bacterium]